ncbi:MAG TPA: PfkB family carbohydrate kinase [Candidatus Acidoferrales bacterium]|nr:PfkB family carbohydrate kinase [Candidatus Acidoferrales bacterium]
MALGSLTPSVVVVGAATRDVDPTEPRGWRLGGGVAYGALLLARLGMRVGALVGLDRAARDAGEPATLVAAGVRVVIAELEHGPVFENRGTPAGRSQVCHETSEPLPMGALPAAWRAAPAFLFAPVAGELGADWAQAPAAGAVVGLGWQGLLRDLVAGELVGHLRPWLGPLQVRADVSVVSREDLPSVPDPESLERLLARAGQEVAVTAGRSGGVFLRRTADGFVRATRWPAVPARREADATGAGDVFLAALVAVRLVLGPRRASGRSALLFAAVAASLSVEDVGLRGVPDLPGVRRRLREVPAGG